MSLPEIVSVADVLGAVAVVISLVYVSRQLRQSTNATRANTVSSITESISNYLLVSAQAPDLATIWAKAEKDGYDSLNPEEEFQIRGFNAALFNCFQNAYDQSKLGTLTQEQWEPYRKMLSGLLAQRPNREFWDRYSSFYPSSFVREVER